MLVLSRAVGERILIGEQIEVTVVRISPGVVRIGIEAPGDVSVMRQELCGETSGSPDSILVSAGGHSVD